MTSVKTSPGSVVVSPSPPSVRAEAPLTAPSPSTADLRNPPLPPGSADALVARLPVLTRSAQQAAQPPGLPGLPRDAAARVLEMMETAACSTPGGLTVRLAKQLIGQHASGAPVRQLAQSGDIYERYIARLVQLANVGANIGEERSTVQFSAPLEVLSQLYQTDQLPETKLDRDRCFAASAVAFAVYGGEARVRELARRIEADEHVPRELRNVMLAMRVSKTPITFGQLHQMQEAVMYSAGGAVGLSDFKEGMRGKLTDLTRPLGLHVQTGGPRDLDALIASMQPGSGMLVELNLPDARGTHEVLVIRTQAGFLAYDPDARPGTGAAHEAPTLREAMAPMLADTQASSIHSYALITQ